MFQLVKPQKAQDENGVIVQSVDRDHIQYVEGPRIINFYLEWGRGKDGKSEMNIYIDLPLRWKPSYDQEEITDNKVQQIKSSVTEAVTLMGQRPIFHETIATI